tara:strand:+ start:484 stop:840 length:357 start_codon:yes stop_codon:yes gene_type:complete
MIKNLDIQELRSFAVEILTKTYMELNQNPTEDTIVGMSLSLAEDLQTDFKNLDIEDIRLAFRRGVRHTEEFNIGPKTWYRWIKKYRDILWDAEYQVKTQGKDPKKVPYYKEPKIKLIK